jgi:hypothetical protein
MIETNPAGMTASSGGTRRPRSLGGRRGERLTPPRRQPQGEHAAGRPERRQVRSLPQLQSSKLVRVAADGTHETLLDAQDGMQGTTAVAVRGHRAYVTNGANLVGNDSNLLLAKLLRRAHLVQPVPHHGRR